jgi:hypothetical protein
MQQHGMNSTVDAGTYMGIDKAAWGSQEQGGPDVDNLPIFLGGFLAVAIFVLVFKQRADAASRAKQRKWLTAFYTDNGVKDKLKDVEVILTHYAHNYEQMRQDVEKKYAKKTK